MLRAAALAVCLLACKRTPAEDSGPCTCTPANAGHVTAPDGAPLTGQSLLAALRRHRRDVVAGKNARDIKVTDDQLRFAIIDYCQPCGSWVHDRMTMEEMFPLDRLDTATRAVCMGLVLPDGTTAYGTTRPANCRE
ncbi:MAG: hypothetical protein ABI867_17130 [Kofleriaceae bacterium]